MVTNSINPIKIENKRGAKGSKFYYLKDRISNFFYRYVFAIKYKICRSAIIYNLKNNRFFKKMKSLIQIILSYF